MNKKKLTAKQEKIVNITYISVIALFVGVMFLIGEYGIMTALGIFLGILFHKAWIDDKKSGKGEKA